MDEQRLREILANEIQNNGAEIAPEAIDDTTSNMTVKWDSLTVMNLVFAIEAETDLLLSDDTIATLTSWPALKAAVLRTQMAVIHAGEKIVPPASFRKVLVLDADGTLWEGIAGEGRAWLSDASLEIQAACLRLRERGVLLAIASKNDSGTVEATLRAAPAMLLKPEDFIAIEESWDDKPSMLRRIAERINIGLDSMVFMDDSEFEREAVRSQLPTITVRSPKDEVESLFPMMVDTSKTAQYHALAAAEKTRPQFESQEEFLASLDIEVTLRLNRAPEAARIAELTQKSNQFNLTTRRYTEEDILKMVMLYGSDVWSIHYRDRFGDQGLVGVIITKGLHVDTFLLSCRVLGRGVEYAPWEIVGRELWAEYIPTDKNEQVLDLWPRLGMTFVEKTEGSFVYMGPIKSECPPYIKVTYA